MRLVRWWCHLLCSTVLVLLSLAVTQVSAAGRTYKSSKDEEKPEYEICRLKELLREEEGNSCVYSVKAGEEKSSLKLTIALYAKAQFRCKKE